MSAELVCRPIGYFQAAEKEKYSVPHQPGLGQHRVGKIVLECGQNYEQALDDLAGFDRIWIIYWFHKVKNWKPKVYPPRQSLEKSKRGVFATRSPHRPNPIGLSCVELLKIEKTSLTIANYDILDGTPILDIKPYIIYADSFTQARQGWTEHLSKETFSIQWTLKAEKQTQYLQKHGNLDLKTPIHDRLSLNPFPHPSHRIELLSEDPPLYQIAYKTWRILYTIQEQSVVISEVKSGYTPGVLNGDLPSKWNDVDIHRNYIFNKTE